MKEILQYAWTWFWAPFLVLSFLLLLLIASIATLSPKTKFILE